MSHSLLTLKHALEARIREGQRRGLGRNPITLDQMGTGPEVCIKGHRFLSFMSNDYLGLASSDSWRREVGQCFSTFAPSASASRLAGGHDTLTAEVEKATAHYFGYEECLFLPSGYQGNLAIISGLLQPGQRVFVDKRIHASCGHALLTTNAKILPYRHADLAHLERRLAKESPRDTQPVVLTESLFSMDGTLSDAQAFDRLKKKTPFFLVADEAHSLGCLGKDGRGVFSLTPGTADCLLGTLGKGLGFFGSFLLLPEGFTALLEYLSSPIMHSTALPPAHAAAVLHLLDRLPGLEHQRQQLARSSDYFRNLLADRGIPHKGGAHIVAIPTGNEERTSLLAANLKRQGILVLAARFPTVPWNQGLLRFGITALHSRSMLLQAADALTLAWHS